MKETEIQKRIRETVTNGGDYEVHLLSSKNKYDANQVLTFEKECVTFKIPAKNVDKIFHNLDVIGLYARKNLELIDNVSFSDNANREDMFPNGSVQAYLGFKEGDISESQLQEILIGPAFENLRKDYLSFEEKSLLDKQAVLLTAKNDFYETISNLELLLAHIKNQDLLQDIYFKAKINASENPVVMFDKKDNSWVHFVKYDHSKAIEEFKSGIFKLMGINEKINEINDSSYESFGNGNFKNVTPSTSNSNEDAFATKSDMPDNKINYLSNEHFVGDKNSKDVNLFTSNSNKDISAAKAGMPALASSLIDKYEIKFKESYLGHNIFSLFGKNDSQMIITKLNHYNTN